MKFAKLIRRNLFRNKARATLTMLLIAAIFFFVAVLLSILENFTMFADAGAGTRRLAVQSAISLANSLPFAHEPKIAAIDGVEEVGKLQWLGCYYKEQKNFFANFAVDHDKMRTVWDDYKITDEEFAAFSADRQGTIVGPELMKRFKWKVGDRITLKSTIFPFNPEVTIIGVYQHNVDSSSLFLREDYFNESMPPGMKDRIGTYWVKVKDPARMAAISQQIDQMFRNNEDPTETFTEKEFQLNFMSMMGNIKLLFTSIAVCSVFMVILLAAITMSMSARERITEISVLKAIGFGHRLLLVLMLIEFTLMAFIGGVLGILIGKVFVRVVPITQLTQGFLVNFDIYQKPMLISLAVSIIVGIVAGGWPALRAANMSVVDGLRRVV